MHKIGCVYIWVPALFRLQSGCSSVCSWSCVTALVGQWAQLNTTPFWSENVGGFFHILHATLTIQVPVQFPKPFERWIYYNTVVIVSLVTCHSPKSLLFFDWCFLTSVWYWKEVKYHICTMLSKHPPGLLVWNILWCCVLMMPLSQE